MEAEPQFPTRIVQETSHPSEHPLDAETILRLYRFHMALCGDPWEAQAQVSETLRAAVRWSVRPRPGGLDWTLRLFQAARYTAAFGRRRARGDARSEADGSAGEWGLSAAAEDVAARAWAARIANGLQSLRPSVRESLALAGFAGLQVEEVAAVLGVRAEEAGRRIRSGLAALRNLLPDSADPEGDMRRLASYLRPEDNFLAREQERWDVLHRGASAKKRLSLPDSLWKYLYRLRAGLSMGARAAAVGLAVGILAFALLTPGSLDAWLSPRSSQTSTPSLAPTAEPSGDLVPPDASICQAWLLKVSSALDHTAVEVDQVKYTDPTATGDAGNGYGCEVVLMYKDTPADAIEAATRRVESLLAQAGFQNDANFTCGCGTPNNPVFGLDWYGNGWHFVQNELQAVLTVSWRPVEPNLCVQGEPEDRCALPASQKLYTLKLAMAVSGLKPFLDGFFNLWSRGDARALDDLVPAFRQRTPTMASLDSLAEIKRSDTVEIAFRWRTMQSTLGLQIVEVEALAHDMANNAPLTVIPFQIQVARVDGQWKVVDLAPAHQLPLRE
jgi:DNA-directed RNA polymerase specialized sigma24 family protein